MEKKNKAVVTVVGNDTIGIIARVSAALAQHEANILDISQTIIDDFFNMIMIVDVDGASKEFQEYTAELEALGGEIGVSIHCQREEIFEKMHRL